jgi:hypothetical protein
MAPPRSLHYRTGWFRVWNSILNNPKIADLDDKTFRNWIEMLCVASLYRGSLPALKDFAFELRMNPAKAEKILSKLLALSLIDEIDEHYVPHDWLEHQPPSDNSTDRVQRYRDRKRNGGNVSETPSDTELEIDPKLELKTESEGKLSISGERAIHAKAPNAVFTTPPVRAFNKDASKNRSMRLSDAAKRILREVKPTSVTHSPGISLPPHLDENPK